MKTTHLFLVAAFCCLIPRVSVSQDLTPEEIEKIGDYLTLFARKEISVGKIRIDSTAIDKKEIVLFANINLSYFPFRENNTEEIYREVKNLLPGQFSRHKLQIRTDGKAIGDLIPLALRTKRDRKAGTFVNKVERPLVSRLSLPYTPKYGLQDRHIALWQSHGFYYEPKLARWEWQRARIFQTVEDLFTQSFVLPYLVPMLENAGANVLIPRERDTGCMEIIVDNDGSRVDSYYTENNGNKNWYTGEGYGFAHLRDQYAGFENPFTEGTYRTAETIKKGNESFAQWVPDISGDGRYAVYVSYKTLPNSADDALYTVYHAGGESQFSVNQRMGGGTWIYLGHFNFKKTRGNTDNTASTSNPANINNPNNTHNPNRIVLSNKSRKAGQVITADAVKIGGGYGNIARRVPDDGIVTGNIKSSDTEAPDEVKLLPKIYYPYQTSGYPRFTEAARYWMQWAGIPDSIYSESKGRNDYTDDYKSRGLWVNYLAGGSSAYPGAGGLNIPLDLSFAFHSDAGTTPNDSIIGTLGIFRTEEYDGVFANGASRYASRDLTDLIQSQIVDDIRALHEPNWIRRGLWNRSYYEARVPRVPAMLLELLSHQNFADMRYGLDPRFRFTVGRSVYKGMLKFICSQYGRKYVVQPLPVNHMSLRFTGENENRDSAKADTSLSGYVGQERLAPGEIELTWQPVDDPLEPTAKPDKYIVYTRIGDSGFDNGVTVNSNSFRAMQSPGIIYSYKVTALNDGGEGFPSEILSAARAFNQKGTVLVINGFNRISAPADFVSDGIAGFYDALDHGVPYIEDISYIGSMKEFRRSVPWMDDDASGFGDSYSNYETMVIAGNTFDYPAIHGKAILKAGWSFVSCSDEAIETKTVDMNDYSVTDLILGKEFQTKTGPGGVVPLEFKTFGREMQEAITNYCNAGGNIFVSGAFVGTDLWDNGQSDPDDRKFATEVLGYKWRARQAAITGKVKSTASPFNSFSGNYNYYNELNTDSYVVESPDAIEPAGTGAYTIFRYSENNLSAGVAYSRNYKTCILGFPFESLRTMDEKEQLMKAILTFFEENALLGS